MPQDSLEELVSGLKGSKKYRHVAESLIRRIGSRELGNRKNLKEAVKATKNKLHQIGGAFVDFEMPYSRWKQELQAEYDSGDKARFLAVCKRILGKHASTRERLPDVDRFYQTIFAHLGPVNTLLDLACGLNPLTLPWMPLPPQAVYYAYDIYEDMVDFINFFFSLIGRSGHASVMDLGKFVPEVQADVALLLKTLPCLEQSVKGRAVPLLTSINARRLVISYPCQSLGGRGKGMAVNYDQLFRELIAETGWSFQRLDLLREMVFVINKQAP
jgi:16S rRNA (guanine(1405)-N(7))-methyltransferase